MAGKNDEIKLAAFCTVIENSRDMIFLKNENHVYIAASQPFVRMVGKKSAKDIVGKTDLEIFEDRSLAKRYMADDVKLMEGGVHLLDYIEPITDDKEQHRYGSTSKYLVRDNDGKVIGILGITKDITKEYLARQNYQKELRYLFELPADVYAVSYVDVDSWRIISQRRQDIGHGTIQECNSVEELCLAALNSVADKESDIAKFYRKFEPEFLHGIFAKGRTHLAFKYERILSNGERHWLQNDVRFMTDIDSGHLCVMLSARNIDNEKQEEQKLVAAAKMDKMTMLLNRETTMEYIRQIFNKEDERLHALFMIDVDNFKRLNDTLGHQAGDEFLIALASEIKTSFRETDIVGRVGGDEFFALMRNVSDVNLIEARAQALLSTINKVCSPYSDVHLSGSIGIAVYPKDGASLEELYSSADHAMYRAKKEGKNTFVFA